MKIEKPTTRSTSSPARPWEDRDDKRGDDNRLKRRAEDIDALNQTLEGFLAKRS